MHDSKKIDALIAETMGSLDTVQRAEPSPFLYSRIIGRLERKQVTVWDQISSVISKPAFAIGIILMVLIVDGISLVNKVEPPMAVSDKIPENSVSAQFTEVYKENENFYVNAYDEQTEAVATPE